MVHRPAHHAQTKSWVAGALRPVALQPLSGQVCPFARTIEVCGTHSARLGPGPAWQNISGLQEAEMRASGGCRSPPSTVPTHCVTMHTADANDIGCRVCQGEHDGCKEPKQ